MPDNNDNNPTGGLSPEEVRQRRALAREIRQELEDLRETEGRSQRLAEIEERRNQRIRERRDLIENNGNITREQLREQLRDIETKINLENEALRVYHEQADAITNIADANKDLFGGFFSLTQGASQNMQRLMQSNVSFGQALGETFSDKNLTGGVGMSKFILLKMLDVSIELALQVEQLRANFVKATGATRDFVKPFQGLRHEMARSGIEIGEMFATMTNLFNGMSEFSQMSENLQTQLLETAVGFDRLGGNSAVVGETLTKVAGESGANVDDRLREIAGTADALGVSVSSLSDQLGATSELFAKFGSEGMEVFKDLAAQAKATGLEVSELYGMMADLDTFEGAAQAAGRLNMVLGGNLLDTYTLLNANEAERIDLLHQALLASGQTFDEMDKFQKREIASALNMSLTEAAQLFGTTREEMSATERALQQSGMTQEEYSKRVAEAATAMERFRIMMTSFAVILDPILVILEKAVWALTSLSDIFTASLGGGDTARAIGNIAALTLTIGGLKKGISMLTPEIESAGDAVNALVGEGEADQPGILQRIIDFAKGGEGASNEAGMIPGLMSNQIEESAEAIIEASDAAPDVENFGKATEKSAKGMLEFGAAILMIGAGVGLAAFGIAQLVKAFNGLNIEQITGAVIAIGLLGGTFFALGYIMATAGAPAIAGFTAFGGAMALVGLGVLLAAFGMAQLVKTFGELDPTNITAIAGAFGTISFAIMGMASSSVGFLLAAAGIATIAAAINSVDTEKANAYSGVLTAIKDLATSGFETGILDSALSFIEGSAEAISNVPADAAEKFSATINSLNELMRLTIAVDDSKLQNLKAIAEAVAQTEGEGGPAALANSIREFLVRMDANQEIVVKLDSYQLARWMNNRSNRQVRLNTQ